MTERVSIPLAILSSRLSIRPRTSNQLSENPVPVSAAESVRAHLQVRYDLQRNESEAIIRYDSLRYKTMFHDILAQRYPEMRNTKGLLRDN
jgi:hypothetical protein